MWVNERMLLVQVVEFTNSSKLLISDGCKLFSGGKFMANYYGFGSYRRWLETGCAMSAERTVH